MKHISDEIVDGSLIFYHSAKDLAAYKYLITNTWRTSSGHYGHALYGNMNPLWEDNFSGKATDQNKLYGSFRFRVRSLRTLSLLYCDVEDGAKLLNGYSPDFARTMMENHGVPDNMIESIMRLINKETYASNTMLKPANNGAEGTLLKYGFNGFCYTGNLDGKTVVFYNPSPANVRFTGVSFDKGKTFMDIPKDTTYPQFLQLVDDFRNPKKASSGSKVPGVQSPGAQASHSSLLSPSALKFMSRPVLKGHLDKVLSLEAGYLGKSLGNLDIIFVEAWYIRFNLTSRRSIYSWVDSELYTKLVLAAHIAAYSCTDSVFPLDLLKLTSVQNEVRLVKLLLPFSIKNRYAFKYWHGAFNMLDFYKHRPAIAWGGAVSPVANLGRFVAGHVFYAKLGVNILGSFYDIFKKAIEDDSKQDLQSIIDRCNFYLPQEFNVFMSGTTVDLDKIDSLSSAGVTFK